MTNIFLYDDVSKSLNGLAVIPTFDKNICYCTEAFQTESNVMLKINLKTLPELAIEFVKKQAIW